MKLALTTARKGFIVGVLIGLLIILLHSNNPSQFTVYIYGLPTALMVFGTGLSGFDSPGLVNEDTAIFIGNVAYCILTGLLGMLVAKMVSKR